MITKLIIKCMFAIAKMSKKASAIYLAFLTIFFLLSMSGVLYGALYLTNGDPSNRPPHVLPILICSFIVLFFVLSTIAITTISSNYVRKNPDKKPVEKEK